MKLRGDLEKRVFITFFIVTFVLIFTMTLMQWQLIRYLIIMHEDKQINDRISRVQAQINSFAAERSTLVNQITSNNNLSAYIQNPDIGAINRIIDFEAGQYDGHFIIYDNDQNLIYGERVLPLEDQLLTIIKPSGMFSNQFFLSLGNNSYCVTFVFIPVLTFSPDDFNPYAVLFYMEEFALERLNFSFDFPSFQMTQFDHSNLQTFPDNFRDSVTNIRRALVRTTAQYYESDISRLSIDSAIGSIIRYDLHNNPQMFILIPFDRDFNSFAHQGLLVFILSLLAMALIMISIAGTWFSKHIISPVKEVSQKMQEIEQNPSYLEPLPKKYYGILGNMINTFNTMNKSLASYSNSLLEYKTIINNLDSGILWMNDKFEIMLCNPSILHIFNVDSFQEVIGKKLNDFVKISDRSFEKARNQELFIPHLEINPSREKKIIKFVIFNIRTVDDAAGLRHVASITDITKENKEAKARERLEMELIKSNKMAELGRMVEGIVHNVNSPLNTIVGYAQLIRKRYPDNEDADKIIAAGNNIARTVKQLMLKVREDSISMMRMIDINEVVIQELDMCRHNIFFSQTVELVTDLKPLHKKVNAAHGEISLCVANLLNNAIQAMQKSEKRELKVETEMIDTMIAIRISDTGVGIPEEHLDKMFYPDFSTKNSGDSEGFGLGLPITKTIVEKYNGHIEVSSALNIGSTFTIYLPWQK